MAEENISLKFRSKNVDETRNYFIKETKQKELMSNKQKKVLTTLNYIKQFLILASAVTESIHFFFSFFTCYSYRNYEFCNRIKNFCNNCRN